MGLLSTQYKLCKWFSGHAQTFCIFQRTRIRKFCPQLIYRWPYYTSNLLSKNLRTFTYSKCNLNVKTNSLKKIGTGTLIYVVRNECASSCFAYICKYRVLLRICFNISSATKWVQISRILQYALNSTCIANAFKLYYMAILKSRERLR